MNDEVTQIKERLDIVDIISSYLTVKRAGANMKANCPFHNEKTPSFMISPERQTFKCFGCFPAGQLIQTAEGFKEIQNVRKGESVYTSKGRLKEVRMTFEREYKGDLLEIIPRMVALPIRITGDHKVFAIRTKNCKQSSRETRICQKNCKQNCPTKYFLDYNVEKVSARELTINDFVLYPFKKYEAMQIDKIDLIEYAKIEKKRGKTPRKLKEKEILIDSDFARLVGLYIAEGSSHRAYIRFSFGGHEEHFAKEVVILIQKIFGLDSSIHHRTGNKTGIEVSCCHSLLACAFEVIFGKGAASKRIPDFLLNQDLEIKRTLIDAIFDGDGTVLKEQKKGIGGRKAIKTISFNLMHNLKDVLISIGRRPSINRASAYVSSKNVNHKISYSISWREIEKTHHSDFMESNGTKYWLLPIKKIVKQDYSGLVYNLNVDEDHSYLTHSFAVANCGEGGDIFSFIEKIEGVDFYNALKILADKAGIKLERKSIQYGNKEFKADKKTSIFEINDWTKRLYHKILLDHPKAEKARSYLKKRGMSDETIKEFEIGYAPDSWDLLVKFLEKKGYKAEEAVAAGVLIRNERGSIYDRFRGRIMFPINNIMGATVAFTSRILIDDENSAKYINSSESTIYIKGKTIYGLDKAKMSIKEADLAVMVEGNMDVIACHQAGFKNVVATSGTAITIDQLKILNRYGGEIAFSFDSDTAGETAMKRAITLGLQNDITTKIVSLIGPFKDPDEAIKSDPKNWQRAVENAKPSLEYWIDLLIRKNPELGVSTKKAIAKEILPVIKTIYSDIEKEYYIKYLAGKLSVSEKALIASLEKTKIENKKPDDVTETKVTKVSILEKILGLVWHEPKLLLSVKNDLNHIDMTSVPNFAEMVKKKEVDKEKIDPKEALVLNQFEMMALAGIETPDEEVVKAEFLFLMSRFRSENSDHLKADFARKIQAAEASGDKEKLKNLLLEFSNLIK